MSLQSPIALILLLSFAFSGKLLAATLTVQSTRLGSTPELLAYNSGHFVPQSNTTDWWRYSAMSGARLFISKSLIEPTDDIPGHGDGVTNQAIFLSRRTALRANPLSATYINWAAFTNRYKLSVPHGSNTLNVDHAASELRRLNVDILVNIGASMGDFPLTGTNDWAGKWELWQHFYAQAFYLGREYDVERFQMFNEPDHSSADGLTLPDYLQRLQLASDAVQSAGVDVNERYGKSLKARLLAPVTAGNVSSTYSTWGRNIVTNRHLNFLGETDTNFWLIGQYDYHEYNSSPATFGSRLATLHSSLTTDMSPEPRFPSSISEFNVHTASTFDTLTETLDTPSKYARFGAIAVNLANNFCNELYCFKFSQTLYSDTIPIKKNGMHYVDNTNAPFNIGGITKAGEAWKLFSKVASPGRDRLSVLQGSGAQGLAITATHDFQNSRYHLFCANEGSDVDLMLNVAKWNLPDGQRLLLEEVSEQSHGGAKALLTVTGNQAQLGIQKSNTVWAISMPALAQEPMLTIVASADTTLTDGTNRGVNYGSNSVCVVRNNSTNSSLRSAAMMKFQLPTIYLPDIQFALLAVRASATGGSSRAQAHVYGVTNSNWSENTVRWSNAPGLLQNVAAGINYTNNFVRNHDDSAQIVGQVVAGTVSEDQMLDVTSYIQRQGGLEASFLVTRDVRFHGDRQDDTAMQITAREAGSNTAPRLLIVRLLDSDDDGISDQAEVNVFGTNPLDSDTDNDNVSDGEEILIQKTDPGIFAAVSPYILRQPVVQSTRVGETVMFDVSALGSKPLHYQWRWNQTNILANATNITLTLTNVDESHSGAYSVLISNAFGSVVSSNVSLLVTNVSWPAFSALIYEPFDYFDDSELAGQGGWLLNGGDSGTIEAGHLEIPALHGSVGNRFTWPGVSMSVRRPLGTNVSVGDVYFSFGFRVDSLGDNFTGIGTVAGFTTGTGTEFGSKLNIRTNGSGGFQLGMSKSGGTTYGDWAPNHFAAGETLFIVGRYTCRDGFGTDDTCDLWLNPAPESFSAAVPPVADVTAIGSGGSDINPIDRFFFRSGSGSAAVAKVVADELRVGFSWASVTPNSLVPITVQLTNSSAVLSWPVEENESVLEVSEHLSPAAWNSVTTAKQTNGGTTSVTIAATNRSGFFRLRR
jgi:hypothetical protein